MTTKQITTDEIDNDFINRTLTDEAAKYERLSDQSRDRSEQASLMTIAAALLKAASARCDEFLHGTAKPDPRPFKTIQCGDHRGINGGRK